MKVVIGCLTTVAIFIIALCMTALCVVYPIVGIPLVLAFAFICLFISVMIAID